MYDLEQGPGEQSDVATEHPSVTQEMVQAVLKWNAELPQDAGDPT